MIGGLIAFPENNLRDLWMIYNADRIVCRHIASALQRRFLGFAFNPQASPNEAICAAPAKKTLLKTSARAHWDTKEGKPKRRKVMLWTIFVILLVLWLLGLVSSYTLGGFIHILLVLAIVVLIINLVSGRRGI